MFMLVCLSIILLAQVYLQSKERICMKLLPEVCLQPRNNPLHFGDDLDYNLNPGSGLRSVCRVRITFTILSCISEQTIYFLLRSGSGLRSGSSAGGLQFSDQQFLPSCLVLLEYRN